MPQCRSLARPHGITLGGSVTSVCRAGRCRAVLLLHLRQAYKRLAMQYHPDKNPAGGDKFKAVCEAYRILNDPEQKAIYDSGAQRPSLRDLQRELNRELAGRELHDWVSDLMRAEREAQQQRADFERRRRAEMQRRADFDREYGGKRSAPAPRGPGALGPGGPRWRNGCVDTPELADPMPFAPKPPGQAAGGTAVPEASPPQGPRESGARPQHSDSLKRYDCVRVCASAFLRAVCLCVSLSIRSGVCPLV